MARALALVVSLVVIVVAVLLVSIASGQNYTGPHMRMWNEPIDFAAIPSLIPADDAACARMRARWPNDVLNCRNPALNDPPKRDR